MIHQALPLLAVLVTLVVVLRKLAVHPKTLKAFQVLPLPFWCYVIPMLGTSFKLLPAGHPLYNFLSQQLLPICLTLLLIGVDLKGIAGLGVMAICLMLTGSLGTILGGLLSFKLYHRWLPAQAWAGIGALSASWIGGSANLLAVKEALHVPDTLVGSLVIVDACVAYSWMAFLIWTSTLQSRWDRWVFTGGVRSFACTAPAPGPEGAVRGSTSSPRTERFKAVRPEPVEGRSGLRMPSNPTPDGWPRIPWLIAAVAMSLLISGLAQLAGNRLPTIGQVINPQTWTVLLVTTAALGLSLTPLSKLEEAGVSKVGTFALCVLLVSIGARADFKAIAGAPVFLALGLTWILIHGACLAVAGYLLKAPLGLIATASQANIGGPISAPIVGATFSSQLATVGLLMAILGNILGTYLGLLTAFLARLL